ncbi:MAG: hypothetical protein U9N62_03475 [Thermotogota bacterium]|nr:hypothetical protein [Thermotogota bacterium]
MTKLKAYIDSQVKPKKEGQKQSDSQVFLAIGLALSFMLVKEVDNALLAFSILNPDESSFLCRSPDLFQAPLHSRTS